MDKYEVCNSDDDDGGDDDDGDDERKCIDWSNQAP